MHKILLCLPTLNEAESILQSITKARTLGWDIVITDGGSTDGTIEIAKEQNIKILERPGEGKGKGIQIALKYAYENGYDYMAVADCDGSYPIENFSTISSYSHLPDMIMFYRELKSIEWHRRLVNKIFIKEFNYLFKSKIKDVTTGMRLLKISSFNNHVKSNGFEVELELCAITINKKLDYIEIKANYSNRLGKSKSNVFTAIRVFFSIILLRFRYR